MWGVMLGAASRPTDKHNLGRAMGRPQPGASQTSLMGALSCIRAIIALRQDATVASVQSGLDKAKMLRDRLLRLREDADQEMRAKAANLSADGRGQAARFEVRVRIGALHHELYDPRSKTSRDDMLKLVGAVFSQAKGQAHAALEQMTEDATIVRIDSIMPDLEALSDAWWTVADCHVDALSSILDDKQKNPSQELDIGGIAAVARSLEMIALLLGPAKVVSPRTVKPRRKRDDLQEKHMAHLATNKFGGLRLALPALRQAHKDSDDGPGRALKGMKILDVSEKEIQATRIMLARSTFDVIGTTWNQLTVSDIASYFLMPPLAESFMRRLSARAKKSAMSDNLTRRCGARALAHREGDDFVLGAVTQWESGGRTGEESLMLLCQSQFDRGRRGGASDWIFSTLVSSLVDTIIPLAYLASLLPHQKSPLVRVSTASDGAYRFVSLVQGAPVIDQRKLRLSSPCNLPKGATLLSLKTRKGLGQVPDALISSYPGMLHWIGEKRTRKNSSFELHPMFTESCSRSQASVSDAAANVESLLQHGLKCFLGGTPDVEVDATLSRHESSFASVAKEALGALADHLQINQGGTRHKLLVKHMISFRLSSPAGGPLRFLDLKKKQPSAMLEPPEDAAREAHIASPKPPHEKLHDSTKGHASRSKPASVNQKSGDQLTAIMKALEMLASRVSDLQDLLKESKAHQAPRHGSASQTCSPTASGGRLGPLPGVAQRQGDEAIRPSTRQRLGPVIGDQHPLPWHAGARSPIKAQQHTNMLDSRFLEEHDEIHFDSRRIDSNAMNDDEAPPLEETGTHGTAASLGTQVQQDMSQHPSAVAIVADQDAHSAEPRILHLMATTGHVAGDEKPLPLAKTSAHGTAASKATDSHHQLLLAGASPSDQHELASENESKNLSSRERLWWMATSDLAKRKCVNESEVT